MRREPAGIVRRDLTGADVIAEVTDDDWTAPGKRVANPEADAGGARRSISADEMQTLLRGAAVAAWKTYTYHATKTANVAGIKADGLDPKRGGTGAAKGTKTFEDHSKGKVHYTRKHGLAEDYKRYHEGDATVFGGRVPDQPGPAEVLQVAITGDRAKKETRDPDSRPADHAVTNTKKIPGKYIRPTSPRPLPAGKSLGLLKQHLEEGLAESSALKSNLPDDARKLLRKLVKAGYDEAELMQTVRQALRSMQTTDILPIAEYLATIPRVGSQVDATGRPYDTYKF